MLGTENKRRLPEVIGEKVSRCIANKEQPAVPRALHPRRVQHVALAAAVKAPQRLPGARVKDAGVLACCNLHMGRYPSAHAAHCPRADGRTAVMQLGSWTAQDMDPWGVVHKGTLRL